MLEKRSRKLLYSSAAKTRQVNMIAFGLHLVIMLFSLQMHEIELIDEPEFLEEFDGAINRSPIDMGLSLARAFE
jgi:hypothetical protein